MLSRLRAAAAVASLTALAFVGLTLAGRADADPNNLSVGAVRTPTSKQGTSLRAAPNIGADILGNLPHGTRFAIQELKGVWIRVTAEATDAAGAKSQKTGWVKAGDTIDPYALTGAGRLGDASAAGGAVSAAAAGRGFDEETVKALAASQAQLAAALTLVDRLEQIKPSPHEVQTFAEQGRLGFPGRTR